MSVIISSHILPEIEETCDRVLIINGGRIVAAGSPAELRHEIFGHSTYRLELAGDPAALAAHLPGIDPTLRVVSAGDAAPDGFRTFTLMTDTQTDLGENLLKVLPAAGYRVRSLGRTQPSLEDVFLAATRRSWDARLPDRKETQGDSRAPLPKV
jgi:ABC-2 type transport system ATP-binding protein